MTTETIQAGKATLTLSHGCVLTYTDADGIPRNVAHDPTIINLFRAMQRGSGVTVQTIRTEGRERPTNVTGDAIWPSYHS